jgi:PAS domain S-box-containing protein
MDRELRILILEDVSSDVELLLRELRNGGFAFNYVHVHSRDDFMHELQKAAPDLVLMDYSLPGFDAMAALRLVQQITPHVPCIVVSGTIGEEVAIETLKKGATDYILKNRMARLVPAVRRALIEAARQTELALAEERIREQATLLDKAQDAIMVLDLSNRITYWNKSAERLYDWSTDQAMGRDATELLHQAPPTEVKAAQKLMFESGEWIGELHQTTHDGSEIIVESRQTLIRDRDGEPESVLVVNTDITQRKKLESQFLRSQRLESIGMLAGGIAHDLNNILTPILMASEVIKSRLNDPETRSVIMTLESSAMRGADMVKQILMFARGVGGQRTEFQIKHILRDLDKIIRETFPKSIEVHTELAADLWMVCGDATQIHQVLLNLCVNARDAMPDGGTLRISSENARVPPPDPTGQTIPEAHLVIEISDTGTGIPKEISEKIFDPFFTTKAPGKGTGLGLSTALSIVRNHGGFMKVDSVPDRGTTFRIFLPAVESAKPDEPSDKRVELPGGKGELLLVVDDDTSIREMTRATLESFGYRVITAANGGQAIAAFAKNAEGIKLVLMDIMMPIMQGTESIDALRKINPQTPVILVTGLSGDESPNKVNDPPVDATIRKPYTLALLLNTVRTMLDSK